jgi:hypothetical protein
MNTYEELFFYLMESFDICIYLSDQSKKYFEQIIIIFYTDQEIIE